MTTFRKIRPADATAAAGIVTRFWCYLDSKQPGALHDGVARVWDAATITGFAAPYADTSWGMLSDAGALIGVVIGGPEVSDFDAPGEKWYAIKIAAIDPQAIADADHPKVLLGGVLSALKDVVPRLGLAGVTGLFPRANARLITILQGFTTFREGPHSDAHQVEIFMRIKPGFPELTGKTA